MVEFSMILPRSVFLSLLVVLAILHGHQASGSQFRSGARSVDLVNNWNTAIQKAQAQIPQLSLTDISNIVTGVGWAYGPCVGNTPPVASINFPGLCLQDSPTGVRFADFASAFPAAVNVAATWDRNLTYLRGAAMGAEHRGKGVNIQLGPMMNMGRVAAGGRNWEGFGADPFLTGELAAQTILGIQSQGVIACAKHFIGNEQEHFRTSESSNMDDRTLHEIYAWPFLQSVLAGVGSVMCSYNLLNGTYACENDRTINQILKGEFGFQGFVMSDWSATMSSAPSVLAGLDMTMPGDITFDSGTTWFGNTLVNEVANGTITTARVQDMATRILAAWYLLGQDQNYPEPNINFVNLTQSKHVDVQGNHSILIRDIGAQSNILLKNNGLLPLPKGSTSHRGIFSYGIIGADAGPATNSSGPNGAGACGDHGCVDGTLAQGWGSGTSNFPYLVTPLEAISYRARQYSQTVEFLLEDWNLLGAAELSAVSDYAIVFVLADSGEGYITWEGNMGDRNNLSLWNNGDYLIYAAASQNPNTIVVLHTVGPVLMPWINHPNISAVILAGLPGQESGNSLADVLFGDVNPSGKLVYTIAANPGDYPASVIYEAPNPNATYPDYALNVTYSEGLNIDYRWFDANSITPTFPFGFGLSYTTFAYSPVAITPVDVTNVNTVVTVSATITNSGPVYGAEAVQLYLSFPASANEPPHVLRGFTKVFLNPQQSQVASFPLSQLDLSIWDPVAQNWSVPAGQFTAYVAAHSRDLSHTATFSIPTTTIVAGYPQPTPPPAGTGAASTGTGTNTGTGTGTSATATVSTATTRVNSSIATAQHSSMTLMMMLCALVVVVAAVLF